MHVGTSGSQDPLILRKTRRPGHGNRGKRLLETVTRHPRLAG